MLSNIHLMENKENKIYIKREDLIPYSFGGNKARKAFNFFKIIDSGNYDAVVTYGSSSSNHARIVANMACKRNMKCIIISPEKSESTYNSKMMTMFNAEIIYVSIDKVKESIEKTLNDLKLDDYKPYFIEGGGHGIPGTQAYIDCYNEIKDFEKLSNIKFDYIFFASGTGSTQAGLVCGKLLHKDEVNIIGISIARQNPRGKDVVIESVGNYLDSVNFSVNNDIIKENVIFLDKYIEGGYGKYNSCIVNEIKETMKNYGVPLDTTYTGKAMYGMRKYVEENSIKSKNILFIHTGGTPLFFDFIDKNIKEEL